MSDEAHAIVRKAFTESQLAFGEFALYIARRQDDTVRAWLANTATPPDDVIRFLVWFIELTAFQRRAYVNGAIAEHHAKMWTPAPPTKPQPKDI